MYVIRKKQTCSFKGYDGWITPDDNGILDLADVFRFTRGEAAHMVAYDTKNSDEVLVWYGSYARPRPSAMPRARSQRTPTKRNKQ
jgi:hypothetical protein